jgi:hypothetical protein
MEEIRRIHLSRQARDVVVTESPKRVSTSYRVRKRTEWTHSRIQSEATSQTNQSPAVMRVNVERTSEVSRNPRIRDELKELCVVTIAGHRSPKRIQWVGTQEMGVSCKELARCAFLC